jgi:hypothetical protein
MDLIKKHYEKVLLGVVLLGLTVAVVLLPFIISAKRADLEQKRVNSVPRPKPLTPLDMAVEDTALQRVQSPVKLDFTTKHNLFNPVVWQKTADGHLVKVQTGNEIGVGALEVTDIKPLYLQLTYNAWSDPGYLIGVERQAATDPGKRSKRETFLKRDTKNDLFTLRDVKGPPDKPTELVLELSETGDAISISPDKPFKRVEGYQADLKYGLEANKIWKNQRVGATLNFAGGQYIVVAITENNVVLSAKSNDKKTTITFNPATEPPR